jgi:hypothetical protein
MKTGRHPAEAVALILATALFAFTPSLPAQNSQDSTPPAQQQPGQQAPDQQQPDQQESKTFQGKIMKLQDGKYALVTGQTAQGQVSGHFLDDQDNAKKYEGKQVKVTGTLETASNTIHVTKIEEAA